MIKDKKKLVNFLWVGISLTLIDYLIYSVLLWLIFKDRVELAAMLSGAMAAIIAYLMHRGITWKERDPGKYGILKFLGWNTILVIAIRPALAFIMQGLEPIYQLAFGVSQVIRLPFNYEFVRNTGIFGLMTAVIMVLNFMVYERLVFGEGLKEKASKGKSK